MRRVIQACLPYRAFLFARTAPKLDGGKRQEARVEITLIDARACRELQIPIPSSLKLHPLRPLLPHHLLRLSFSIDLLILR